MQNTQPSKRKVTVIQTDGVLTPGQLPQFKKANPSFQRPANESVNVAPQPLPSFQITTDTSNQTPPVFPDKAIDFKELKAKQRQTVAEHIEREDQIREETSNIPQYESVLEINETRVEGELPNDGYSWERVYLPSQGKLGYDSITLRPFSTQEILQLHRVRISKNESSLFDIINTCAHDFDIRTLPLGDFRFVFYWLKLNSFTKNPFTIKWTSKYGNANTLTLNKSDLEIIPLDIDPDDIEYYIAKGFCVPTLRDGEEFNRYLNKIKDETERASTEYEVSYAQFIQGKSIAEKLEILRDPSRTTPDDLIEILEFSNCLNFGVKETVSVKDAKFNALEAIEFLNKALITLNDINLDDLEREDLKQMVVNNRSDISEEIARIELDLNNLGEAAASSETVSFNLGLDNFFPENIFDRK
jgi:hypothetical protein